jgi:hypothetical protein
VQQAVVISELGPFDAELAAAVAVDHFGGRPAWRVLRR